MLGEFITRCLVLFLGYAYPAFECFKSVEKNKVDIAELRFWCQYWIIIGLLTVCDWIGDIFLSWLPLYDEMKLAFMIYLWHPKTKGTTYIYEALLRPLVAKHETDIDRRFLEYRARAWDFALYYWQNCTELGQGTLFQVLQYLTAQSERFKSGGSQKSSPVSPPVDTGKQGKRPPRRPTSPGPTMNRSLLSESPIFNRVQVPLEPTRTSDAENIPESDANEKLHPFRMRFRRSKPNHD